MAMLQISPVTIFLCVISLVSLYISLKLYKMMQKQTKILSEADFSPNFEESAPGGVVRRRMSDSSFSKSKLNESNQPIYRICVTGGPCAGKTTSLTTIRSHLQEKGFKVLEVPEAATLMMKGG